MTRRRILPLPRLQVQTRRNIITYILFYSYFHLYSFRLSPSTKASIYCVCLLPLTDKLHSGNSSLGELFYDFSCKVSLAFFRPFYNNISLLTYSICLLHYRRKYNSYLIIFSEKNSNALLCY